MACVRFFINEFREFGVVVNITLFKLISFWGEVTCLSPYEGNGNFYWSGTSEIKPNLSNFAIVQSTHVKNVFIKLC